jgi:hypothetical protein
MLLLMLLKPPPAWMLHGLLSAKLHCSYAHDCGSRGY